MTRMTLELCEKWGAFDQPLPPRQQLSAMVEHWPKKLPDAELICTEAIRSFEGELLAAQHNITGIYSGLVRARTATLPQIKRALSDLATALNDTHPIGRSYLAERLRESDVDADELLRGLAALERAADYKLPKRKQGRTKADAIKAALSAADVLMRNGIRRKRAARMLAALMAVYPNVEAKTEEVLEQTIRNAKG